MRIGIVHPALAEAALEATFRRAAQAGAEGVEVHYASPAFAHALDEPMHARELQAAAASSGVAIPSLCLDFLAGQPYLIGRPEVIETGQQQVRRALRCAAEAGAAMVVVPFFGRNAIELEEELTRASDALLGLLDDAEEAGVVLAVESTLAFHQQEFLLAQLGNTGSVLVSCNTAVALSRKMDAATGIRQIGAAAIGLVRFKDVRITEGLPPDFSVPLGRGNVDFGTVAQALRAVSYDGWVIAEPPLDAETLQDPTASAARAIHFTRELLAPASG